jgi:hypothetical protein
MHNVAEKTKLEVFHVLKTGKPLHRTNLFRKLFRLAGLEQKYYGIKFTDGVVKSTGRRRAVVKVNSEIVNKITELQQFFSQYIGEPYITQNLDTQCSISINVNYSTVNWNKIDLELQEFKPNK